MASKKSKFSEDKEKKQEIIKKFGAHEGDTGSPRVQIALLTERVNYLTGHLKEHGNDSHSKRGLIKIVSQRRKMIKHLQRTEDKKEVEKFLKSVGVKKK